MADNYLERRMEEHRRSRSGATVKHVSASRQRLKPGQVIIDYQPMRVIVADGTSSTGREIIKLFRKLNCRVTFCSADTRQGPLLAQATGALYYPGPLLEAIEYHKSNTDPAAVIIDVDNREQLSTIHIPTPVIDEGPHAIAAWCVYAAHPSVSWTKTR